MTPPTTKDDYAQLRWFLAVFAAYVSICLVLGWVREPLFLGVGEDGWPAPSAAELIYLIYMTCLPVALWFLVGYAVACRLRPLSSVWAMFVVLLLVLTVIELDHAWYGMSGHHATWREVKLFLSEDWKVHYGIRNSDVYWFFRRMSMHIAGLLIVFGLSRAALRWKTGERIFSIRFRHTLAIVAMLVVVDVLLGGYEMSHGHDQWQAVADANPFRVSALDRLSTRTFSSGGEHDADLQAANGAFEQATRDAMHPPAKVAALLPANVEHREQYNVVLVTVEGLNPSLIDSTTMPYLMQLARRSTLLRNHYTTGNVTEYGVLGVLYGAPPDFYRGTSTVPWRHQIPAEQQPSQPGSQYLDEFARRGYHTRLISWELSSWANLGVYFHNFTEPAFESRDDWQLVPELARELHEPGSHFVYMHYNGTHFPYDHGAAYERFTPEVPRDYDYASWRLREQAPEIINRYRNCLSELDAWLHSLTGEMDLQNTIVVITGDHGEEFFEHNRLGHASRLDGPQIQTFALIYAPGRPPRVIDAVTSHADIMPTLMDLLGWPPPVRPFGQSLVGEVTRGAAIVAMTNRPNPPNHWAAVAENAKAILALGPGDTLHITALADTDDHPLSYRADPTRWRAAFDAAARLQLHLRAAEHLETALQRSEAQ
ncbi:MAG: sulfatase-like hydrolase/transferase [Gemmatimonadales bacterium]|jgi:arylsulfatase A-like enzyme